MNTNDTIKKLRKERGLTQEKLAELVGVSLMTVRRWEWGETSPNAKILPDLARVLETTPESLLNNTEMNLPDFPDVSSRYIKEQMDNKQGLAMIALANGQKVAAPATPEGFAFLERLFVMANPQVARAV